MMSTEYVAGSCIIGELVRNPFSYLDHLQCLSDDIYQESPPKLLYSNVLGGAGIYAALGARIFREIKGNGVDSKSVGMIVHEGCDFPVDAKVELQSWCLSSIFVRTPHRLTTRGKNVYSKEGVRGKSMV